MSPRETLQVELASKLSGDKRWNAPYGVLTSRTPKYRSITFGRAATLDAEIRIYHPTFILLRWQTANRSFAHKGQQVFSDPTELMFFAYELGSLNG